VALLKSLVPRVLDMCCLHG